MIDSNYFLELIRHHYAFLEHNYSFIYTEVEDTQREVYVKFRKGEMQVNVSYSRTNNYVDVRIYNHVSKVRPGQYIWKYGIRLENLLTYYDSDINYDDVMPDKIPLENSIQKTASLLNYYGDKILSGKEWISSGDVTGYNQYVPPDFP